MSFYKAVSIAAIVFFGTRAFAGDTLTKSDMIDVLNKSLESSCQSYAGSEAKEVDLFASLNPIIDSEATVELIGKPNLENCLDLSRIYTAEDGFYDPARLGMTFPMESKDAISNLRSKLKDYYASGVKPLLVDQFIEDSKTADQRVLGKFTAVVGMTSTIWAGAMPKAIQALSDSK